MKNENVSINIRPVVNGWIFSEQSMAHCEGNTHVFTTPESLGAFVAQFYGASLQPSVGSGFLAAGVTSQTAPVDDPEHNPDNLTPYQVGVKDGWRLLRKSEIISRPMTDKIWQWQTCDSSWDQDYEGSSEKSTYRTKLPFGQL